MSTTSESLVEGIAIIGAVGRFPGASDLGQFWANLTAGVESVSVLTDAQLTESGFDPQQLRADPRYVPVRGIIERAEWFDAAFFGFTPREAQLTDPQHRLFLEAAWEALESAGCDPSRSKGAIGVFAGCGNNTWARRYFARDLDDLESGEWLESAIGNEKDYVATRVAYKLNLRGPAVNVNTACSTSLVAVCQACQALWTYQCDVALAGGVNVSFPQGRGYYHDDEGISSPDGHTRAFDVDARGTVFSNGLGVVVLKRLGEALEDGDEILAVIRGAAINNDGSGKASFTAPSADGQADVVALAQAMAGVSPDSVSYVETHGTATPIGDVIELAGLTKAFRLGTARTQFCAIGSVKSNIGHVEHAAGVAGLIKTALALQHRQIPPSLHYTQPNPKLQVSSSPFFVNHSLREWSNVDSPRRAGVSSFGVGGTNAHVVLEEAPPRPPSGPSHPWHLLPLSAKTGAALDGASSALADFLRSHPETQLADVAFTLQRGRSSFDFRRAVAARCPKEASAILSGEVPGKSIGPERAGDREVIFMFPGGGAQYCGAARGLYSQLPEFKQQVDACLGAMDARIAAAVSRLMLVAPEEVTVTDRELAERPSVGLPMLFAIEFATAQYWLARGVKPAALIGHSLGEYAAACLSGVMALNDAVALVQLRGRLFDELPAGAMLSIGAAADRVTPYLEAGLDVAVINGPASCVVSGRTDQIGALAERLERDGLETVRLHIAVAAHSSLVEPILPAFRSFVSGLRLHAPRIPIVSNVTGTWLGDSQAVNPDYWVDHLRRTVRFSEGLQSLFTKPNAAFVEVGPGRVLSTITRAHPDRPSSVIAIESMRHPQDSRDDYEALLAAQARLWVNGVAVDWEREYRDETRRRVALPTYPFERQFFGPVGRTTAREPSQIMPTAVVPGPASLPQPPGLSLTAPDRRERIANKLCDILHELSGLDRATLLGSATFIELGFDSLSLTQVSQLVLREFRVRVKFRHLLDTLPTVPALAAHLDGEMPPEAPAPSVASSEVVSSTLTAMTRLPDAAAMLSKTPNPPEFVQEVIRQQLALMTQQIAVLQGAATAAPPSSPPDRPTVALTGVQDRPLDAGGLGAVASLGRLKPELLTSQQRRYLAELIERYTSRTAKSKELTQRFRPRHADPRTASGFTGLWKELVYPIVVSRSGGSRLWDVDGNEYIDLLCGFGPTFLGHGHEVIVEAINQQLARGFELGPQTPLAGEVADLFCDLTGQERVSFVNTGSEAVQAALRLARTVTGRTKVATFTRDYHGNFDEMLVRGLRRGNEPRTVPSAPGIPQRAVDDVIVLDYGTDESLEFLKRSAHELAAIVVEPIQSRRPEFQPREFLQALRALTLTSETLLVFDEVVTGLRIGPGGAQAHFGIQADLATYGKVLGGGMPIGAVAGRAEFMDTFDGGQWQYGDESMPVKPVTFFAGTFARHPLAMAAAKATLTYLKAGGQSLWDGLNTRSDRLADALDAICRREGIPVRVPHFRSMMYPCIEEGHGLAYLLFYELRTRGVYLHEPYPCYLNLAHSDDDIARVIAEFEAAVSCLRANGVFERMQSPAMLGDPASAGRAAESESSAPPSLVVNAAATEAATAPANRRSGEVFVCDASLMQEGLWFIDQAAPLRATYNIPVAFELRGRVDWVAFQRAVDDLVERHGTLRTSFTARDGAPLQVISPASRVTVEYPVISDSPTGSAEVHALIQAEAEQPFDLAVAPLLRVKAFSLSDEKHLVSFVFHHIIVDGWSIGAFFKEFAAAYAARAAGRRPELPPVAVDYADFSIWQRQHLTNEVQEAQLDYWRETLTGAPDSLELPTDRPRPKLSSGGGWTEWFTIDAKTTTILRELCRREQTTMFMAVVSVIDVLLARHTGVYDIVVGSPMAGQVAQDVENTLGFFVNTLALRTRFSPDVTFRELLGRTRATTLGAYENADVPFSQVVGAVRPERVAATNPLFQVMCTFEAAPDELLSLPGLGVRPYKVSSGTSKFDLLFDFQEHREVIEATLEYSSDLFDVGAGQRWVQRFLTLAGAAARQPNVPVSALTLMPPAERDQIRQWSVAAAGEDSGPPRTWASLPDAFDQQAKQTPEASALVMGERAMTYGELRERSNRVARYLDRVGVARGHAVGLCMDRSFDLVVALLGILKAGAAYVPLDPNYPAQRLTLMAGDAALNVILADGTVKTDWADRAVRVVRLDADWPLISGKEAEPPQRDLSGADLAYIIYTSGSTGQPKGVAMSHAPLLNLLQWQLARSAAGRGARTLQFAPISFDVSFQEIFATLCSGGSLVLIDDDGRRDSQRLLSTLRDQHVNRLFLPFVALQALCEAAQSSGVMPGDLTEVITAGEQLQVTTSVTAFFASLPRCSLDNQYGPTESHVVTAHRLEGAPKSWPLLPPIGRPIANARAYVLDDRMTPVPIGVPGEIYLGGAVLAQGYYGKPELTAERFCFSPFEPGIRLYRTGDAARWRPDGALEFLGRLDSQIKIRGHRVELSEIEAILCTVPGIESAVVSVIGDDAVTRRLVGYVVSPAGSVDSETIRQHLRLKLPEYMVPAIFVGLDRLPRTPTGKIDRRSLPAPLPSVRELPPVERPADPIEERIATIFRDVLNDGEVGRHDNFFDRGGHSLQVMRVLSRVRDLEGAEVTVQEFFAAPTVAGLAEATRRMGRSVLSAPITRIQRSRSDGDRSRNLPSARE